MAAVLILLVAQGTSVPDRLRLAASKKWQRYLIGRGFWGVLVVLIVATAIGILTSNARSGAEQGTAAQWASIQQQTLALQEKLKSLQESNNPPLSEPTALILIDSHQIDSLYSQYEPDLVEATVTAEIKNSTEIGAEVSIESYLSTNVGRSEYLRRVEEYKAAPKSTERELKNLLKYLYDKNLVTRFNAIAKSDDLKKLDEATDLLATKYQVVVDKSKLRVLRDRLLAADLAFLEKQLASLHGLVLVEGDWSLESRSDAYILRRPFVSNVTNPAVCEVKMRKSAVTAESRDTIESLAGKPVRLSVFGNVLVGASPSSRTVVVTPFAVF